jgi:hypothetical protein
MINKNFNFFAGSKSSLADSLREVTIRRNLFKKQIGKKKEEISEEATITFSIVNEKTFDYNLNIINEDYEFKKVKLKFKPDWKELVVPVTNDLAIKLCTENGRDVIIF